MTAEQGTPDRGRLVNVSAERLLSLAATVEQDGDEHGVGRSLRQLASTAVPSVVALSIDWQPMSEEGVPEGEWLMAESRLTGTVAPLFVLPGCGSDDLVERYTRWHRIARPAECATDSGSPHHTRTILLPLDEATRWLLNPEHPIHASSRFDPSASSEVEGSGT